MAVPLLDLKAQYQTIRDEVQAAVNAVLESQRFILGPEVETLEAEIARYCQVPHAIGVSSGSDALLAALMAEGIGPGDEVITTPYSFFATVGAIERVGAKTVLVDIERATCNIDPSRIEHAITSRTKAIIAVHLYGQMAEMDPIAKLGKERGLIVIEDAAQAIGAELDGRRAGSIGDYGCLSFFPSKNLGCAGDGGMIVCRDDERAERLRVIRNHGAQVRYFHTMIGGNFRLDALQAAILRVKLPYLDGWTAARQRNAARYRELLAGSGIELPYERQNGRHVYNQFVIRTERREALRALLNERGIGNEIYYPQPFHLQACFAGWSLPKGSFPESELASEQALALPIYPELTDEQLREVASAVLAAS